MLANYCESTTTSIAGTLGDGAVTLTGKAPYMLPSKSFGSTAQRRCTYVIEDITDASGKFERGEGSVSSDVLTRSVVKQTWNGTTNTETGASITPLQFGSTPTSGNVRVRIALLADSAWPCFPSTNHTIGTGWQGRGLISQNYTGVATTAGQSLAVSTEYYFPYLWVAQSDLIQVGIETVASAASTGIKIAIYDMINGLPGNHIASMAAIATTSNAFLSTTASPLPIKLPVGWYYIGCKVDSATPTFMSPNSGLPYFMQTPMGREDGYGFAGALSKTAEDTYANGMPTGVPAGTYTARGGTTIRPIYFFLKPRV